MGWWIPVAAAAGGYIIDRQMGGNGLKGAMLGGSLGYGSMGSGSETAAAEGGGKGVTSMDSATSANSLNGGANLLGGTSTAVGTGATTGATTGILNTSNNLQNVTGGVTGQGFSPYATTDTLGQSIAQVDMPLSNSSIGFTGMNSSIPNPSLGLDTSNAIKDPLTGQAVAPQYNSIPQVEEAPLYTGAVNPNFADIQKSSPTEIAEAQGGFEGDTPLYEKAFDSVVGFAEKNPIALATLGMTALGATSAPSAKQVTQSAGQVARQAYQPRQSDILKVRRA
jgi:hypothetical protein